MSSTNPHYQPPSSLPSDYAILEHHQHRQLSRRDSFPPMEEYYRPPKPTIASRPTESTPLLSNPPVPRIEEAVDNDPTPETRLAMFWDELLILTRYALPVFGTHVLEYSLVIVSVISIGHISTTALAAISLGSMTASVSGFSIIQGMASALDTLLPSAWTSTQPQLVGLWTQRMTIVMSACLVPTFIIWFNAEAILLALHQEPDVAHLAATYLRWVSLGLPAYAFNCISRRYFQSQGLFNVPTRIVFIVAPVNALLNYFLVWGPPPFQLGFIGAPIATAISFNLISFLSIAYGVLFTPTTAWSPLELNRQTITRLFDVDALMTLAKLGFSGVGQTASEWWAWELVALAASLLGPVALATQSVLLVSASTTYQAPFALSVATAVRIGNLLGEQNAVRAGVAARTSVLMAFFIAVFTSSLFLIFRYSWAYMFNSDPEVVALTASIIPLVSLFQVFDGLAAVTGGILRAQGKQFIGAVLNITAYYVFGIPLGCFLAFTPALKYGLHGLWMGLTFSLVYCAMLGSWFSVGPPVDWHVEAERVAMRMARERERNEETSSVTKGPRLVQPEV